MFNRLSHQLHSLERRAEDAGRPMISPEIASLLSLMHNAGCEHHLGQKLRITNVKDYGMVELWDDRAIQVEMNTGRVLGEA